jgi:hypothetical protein
MRELHLKMWKFHFFSYLFTVIKRYIWPEIQIYSYSITFFNSINRKEYKKINKHFEFSISNSYWCFQPVKICTLKRIHGGCPWTQSQYIVNTCLPLERSKSSICHIFIYLFIEIKVLSIKYMWERKAVWKTVLQISWQRRQPDWHCFAETVIVTRPELII